MRRNDICTSDGASDDGKTNSIDSVSVGTTVSSLSQALPRVTLSGPVTDLWLLWLRFYRYIRTFFFQKPAND